MTGYESKRAMAQDKLKCQCSMTTKLVGSGCQYCNPEYMDDNAFNDWWDSDYDDSTNPYEKDTFAYWAWAGWQAALAQEKSNGT